MDSRRFGTRGQDYAAGMTVYDIKDPANPRRIGFLEVEGLGIHRIWWIGGRYAYASALLDGFIDHILIVIDMADPTKPRECGRWWIPGMNAAAGETPSWSNRYALHHAIVRDDFAYGSWRDGGLTILDVKDKSAPKLIAHRTWSPPFGGGTHNAVPLHDRNLLVVADEATLNIDQQQMKYTWVFDIREKSNPISIATMPTPVEQDYVRMGGQFGPHNLHENRPGSFESPQRSSPPGRAPASARSHCPSVPAAGDRPFRAATADGVDGTVARPGKDAAQRRSVRIHRRADLPD